ncbi:hypothetical protein [Aeromonas rivipollensis]|uniref:hypothetical protein n=1 Tax=Aeromonas rivipollensis TaxID=948519 RepID=UPI0038D104D4
MIAAIYGNPTLSHHHKDEVSENGISVKIDPTFYSAPGVLDRQQIANISVDEYYNSLGLGDTPPSIDNIVIVNRGGNKFSMTLIELKKVKRMSTLDYGNIVCKYKTTIDDFMLTRFKNEFDDPANKVTDLNLWLVYNRFNYMGKMLTDEEYERRIKSTIVEKLLLTKPFTFKNRIASIMPMLCDRADII